jgi:hypothetical protein
MDVHPSENKKRNFYPSDVVPHRKLARIMPVLLQEAGMFIRAIAVFALLLMTAGMGLAQAPDTPEQGSQVAIAEATTEERFLSPWVSYIPEHPTVPSPTDHLGHIAGAPGELSNTETIYAYYRALADTSDRLRVEVIGRTEEGREFILPWRRTVVSSKACDTFIPVSGFRQRPSSGRESGLPFSAYPELSKI